MESLKSSSDNKQARLLFVDFWANFIRTHPDEEWGEQQNILIDSQFSNK